ncbi:NUDIX hydrolase [Pseudomonas sp. PIC25]|uniref:NUDIX hydrolase n=1 Tax=Pseudomonas sp. PIC25 TaxID=1958773 RepID=UPI000BAC1165|nr:NUDIX domain-containing protein [Pseudomonas sp. PIC25]PAU64107.1 NUDIX hydrolase [Pseudomonas sp. PIC25]
MTIFRIAAACLLDAQGRLLLVRKRGTRAFMLPGGKHEPGESALEAVLRELSEEIELSLPAEALHYLGRFQAPAANEPDCRVDADVFCARLLHPVRAAAELEELAWLDPGSPLPDSLAPLLREQVLPVLQRHLEAETA